MTPDTIGALALCIFLAYLRRRSMRKTDQVRAEMAAAGSLAARRATEDGQRIAWAHVLLHDKRARAKDKNWRVWAAGRDAWDRANEAKGVM
jgi:hypothetical protein